MAERSHPLLRLAKRHGMSVRSARPPNKAMKLTSPERIGGLQLIAGVRPTVAGYTPMAYS